MARGFQSLYATFGSGSTARNSITTVQLTTPADERLEEWKERDDDDDDARSDISKEDVLVTTALIGTSGGELGEPEVRRRFWSTKNGKGREEDLDAIATQPSVFDDPDLVDKYRPQPDW